MKNPLFRFVAVAGALVLLAGAVLYPTPPKKLDDGRILQELQQELAAQGESIACLSKALDYGDLLSVSALVKVGGGSGSGVLVTRKIGEANRTFVWTAAHVAAVVRKQDGTFGLLTVAKETRVDGELTGNYTVEAEVVAYSESEDLALLEIMDNDFTTASASFLLDDAIPAVGTEVVHVGSTLGLCNSVSLGVISQTDRQIEGVAFDQTSTMGYPGSSGGGVFLKDGRCIGLLTQGYGPGLNFIVPVRRMRDWAARLGILWALDPSHPVPTHVVRDAIPVEVE